MASFSQKSRITFFIGTLNLGGIERLVTDLSIALKNSGHWEPSVCCLISKTGPFVQTLEDEGIAVYECSLKPGFVTFPFRLARIVKSISPDLVHSQVAFSLPWQVLGVRLAGVSKIVITQHSDYPYWKTHRLARWRIWVYFRLCWPFISAYTTVSRAVRNSLSDLVELPAEKFHVIYNPVNLDKFTFHQETRLSTRQKLDVGRKEFIVGNVGRLDEPKGHSYLLQASALVIQALPDVLFVIIGDGPLADALKAQTRELGIEQNVRLLGQQNEVQAFYPGFDCFASASLREGFHIALTEAMACGLPIVATRVGGVTEVLGDEYPFLVPSHDPQAIAQAILHLATNPEEAQKLGIMARRRVEKMFDLASISQQYDSLYKEILGR